jgi:hypothetical protein
LKRRIRNLVELHVRLDLALAGLGVDAHAGLDLLTRDLRFGLLIRGIVFGKTVLVNFLLIFVSSFVAFLVRSDFPNKLHIIALAIAVGEQDLERFFNALHWKMCRPTSCLRRGTGEGRGATGGEGGGGMEWNLEDREFVVDHDLVLAVQRLLEGL